MNGLLNIAGIQANLHWEDKKANLEMFADRIRSLSPTTEIVVLPEMFSTGFSMRPDLLAEGMEGDTVSWMKRLAAEKKIIVTGSLIIGEAREGGAPAFYNRLVWMLPNGQFGYYDKRHLFAYGDEDRHYTAGSRRLIASVKGWKVNVLVCYDLRFPVWARQQPGASSFEYDLLVYVANWPEKRIAAWKALLCARAIENQCYVVGVNRVGKDANNIYYPGESMVVDPAGEILYQSKDNEDVFTVALDRSRLEDIRTKFPFWKDADRFRIITTSE